LSHPDVGYQVGRTTVRLLERFALLVGPLLQVTDLVQDNSSWPPVGILTLPTPITPVRG
jgi:hypothetical protein